MSHFAQIKNGIVVNVIVAEQDFISSGVVGDPNEWLQTSYNTRGGLHYGPDGLPDNGIPFRKNYACIGYVYDPILDAFIPPKPFDSWLLNTESCLWEAPIPVPDMSKPYQWDESSLSWIIDTTKSDEPFGK